ncbi:MULTISPECIES: DNA polymerase III subunit gamma/tau [Bacillaceae]|uniref:DNA-directed DNA polymerase n=1 Tax=Evansella alkalicola TaxID=745819 RepID=A0ABS6JSP1_9BACI|nr:MULTISPECIES: DNA polymerase III subunit gamma/tau [Bacillaceae]MBU9721518.1 DNA polymerase III subunit gamma/tau [Bacillus alkalicola]
MSYQALYRVWRPKCLSDVVGQEHITKTLKNALIQEKLSHAYLFTGPRGTGKTSAAKIVAKAINCENAPVEEPCNNCRACRGISDGSIVDVMEIDAASNNGVDEIRDIRDKVKFAPSSVKYKVYIIDEVHMLSTGAFNALLKTLEEPPRHVIFILATTEPHKIPLTIISRCQRFDFKRISAHAMIDRMKEIINSSSIKVDEDALSMIARVSEGGMRDALSLLDQAISYADDVVRMDDVLSITGAVSQQLLYDVANALNNSDVAKGLTAVDTIIRDGKDPNRFLEDLIFLYRDVLMYKAAPQLDEVKDRLALDENFQQIADQLENAWIYEVMEMLNRFQQEMKWSSHPKVFLEMFIVQVCHMSSSGTSATVSLDQNETIQLLLKRVNELEASVKRMSESGYSANGNTSDTQVSEPSRGKPRPIQASGKSRVQISRVKGMLQRASKQHLQQLNSHWAQVMEQVKQQSVPASAWLNDSKPVACSDGEFVLAFKNEMHRDMIDDKFRALVEQTVSTILQRTMTLSAILENHWEETKDAFLKQQKSSDGNSEQKEEEENPLVQEAVKLFGEDLVEIKD